MNGAVLPGAVRPFVAFAALLRANGFAVAPEQTTTFLSAITLLGPRSLNHIRRAAHATLAPPIERREEFDALFDAHFLGAVELGREAAEPDTDDLRVQEDRRGGFEPPASDEINEAGRAATAAEAPSAASRPRTRPTRCGASSARCPSVCRSGAATGVSQPSAAPDSTCGGR
jgi:uncharacterized protein with von Willebrand factor type A (vWA) domain